MHFLDDSTLSRSKRDTPISSKKPAVLYHEVDFVNAQLCTSIMIDIRVFFARTLSRNSFKSFKGTFEDYMYHISIRELY